MIDQQNGATFKFNSKKPGCKASYYSLVEQGLLLTLSDTDFIAAGGAGNHSWNVVRSEADHILFMHAGTSGAKIFDGTKVSALDFEPQHSHGNMEELETSPGRPVSASWSRKEDGSSGTIRFKYLVDASGRAGLVSTKYKKNRKYNQGLKSVAQWGYWKSAGTHGPGEGDPFFEAIQGTSPYIEFMTTH